MAPPPILSLRGGAVRTRDILMLFSFAVLFLWSVAHLNLKTTFDPPASALPAAAVAATNLLPPPPPPLRLDPSPPPPPPISMLPPPPSPSPARRLSKAPQERPVHVVVGADREHWPGVVGVVNSLVANSAHSSRLRITALVPAGLESAFCAYLTCHGLAPTCDKQRAAALSSSSSSSSSGFAEEFAEGERLRVAGFAYTGPPLKVQTKLTNLESPLNFARFYLSSLLPASAGKVLYLDADVIVQGDAAELSDQSLPHGELCAATLRPKAIGDKGVASLKGAKLGKRFRERYGAELPLTVKGFNAGFFVFNLREWRRLNLTAEAEHWIVANNREKLYALGSQPPLTLSILGARKGTGRCQPLPPEWHLDCLGCLGAGRLKTPEQLRTAKLLHWNGPNKPFTTGGRGKKAHKELFKPYQGKGDKCRVGG